MEYRLHMIEFDWWLCLITGILLVICGVVGLVDDILNRRRWWKFVLHALSVLFGCTFVFWTIV